MDLRILEYMTAIEKYGNMTEAAHALFITPSALNQQLLKLEKELDIQLFTRSRRKMIPTKAGNIYLDAARQMLMLRQAAYSHLQDLAGCVTGTYKIGLTYDHGSTVFARIYPIFHSKYPGIQMRCYQLMVPEMLDMLTANELDLAFVLNGDVKLDPDLEYIPLSAENLLLGLHKDHPLSSEVDLQRCPYKTVDLRSLTSDCFALSHKNTTMRSELIDVMFEKSGFMPNIMIESCCNNFLEQLSAQGICDAIIPQSQVKNRRDIAWFYLPDYPRFHFGVAYRKSYRINEALKYFIALARHDAQKYLNFDDPSFRR